jgi:hypothetical protein
MALYGRGFMGWLGLALADARRVAKDPTEYVLIKATNALKHTVGFVDREITIPGAAEPDGLRVETSHDVSGSIVTELNPAVGLKLLAQVLQTETDTANGTNAYDHVFKGADTFGGEGLAITEAIDGGGGITSQFNNKGVYLGGVSLDITPHKPITATYQAMGLDAFDQVGTAGTSQGQNAVSLPVTLVVSTSDQIKLNVSGGGATEVTIAAAVYTTAAALQTAINTAIAGVAALLDANNAPIVACHVDSSNKVNFYSAAKGIAASVAWTAGTHDAGTLLGRGTPVEAAGAATQSNPTPSLTVQPFIADNATVSFAGSTITAEKVKLDIGLGLAKHDVLGLRYSDQFVLSKRREVKGEIDVLFSDASVYTKFINNTTFALQINLATNVTIPTSSPAIPYAGVIILNICKINAAPKPAMAGPGPVKQKISFVAKNDPTYQDVYIKITNGSATV